MDLRSQSAFWPIESGLIHTYPVLHQNEKCDLAIIGAGITGALVAYELSKKGVSCILVDTRDVGGGSTSASTGLLQYEIDIPLYELIEKRGVEDAVRAYQLCWESIDKLIKLGHEIGVSDQIQKVPSLFLASKEDDLEILEKELTARQQHQFKTSFFNTQKIESLFPFSAPGALWTHQAAQMNPYLYTHALLKKSIELGSRIYDRTNIIKYRSHSDGVTLVSEEGFQIESKRVVFATGYVTPEFLDQKIVQLSSTYALISEPRDTTHHWHENCLIWETTSPYHYLRTYKDRILIGGEDEEFVNGKKRDSQILEKSLLLKKYFNELFPSISYEMSYGWAGTFGSTKDGLGYIGEHSQFPNGYFSLGYGGNGITYSVIASEIIRDHYLGIPNKDAEIFKFDR